MVKMHATVIRRDVQTDWQGKQYVRLDLMTPQNRDLHLYGRATSALAAVQKGQKIKIVLAE